MAVSYDNIIKSSLSNLQQFTGTKILMLIGIVFLKRISFVYEFVQIISSLFLLQ